MHEIKIWAPRLLRAMSCSSAQGSRRNSWCVFCNRSSLQGSVHIWFFNQSPARILVLKKGKWRMGSLWSKTVKLKEDSLAWQRPRDSRKDKWSSASGYANRVGSLVMLNCVNQVKTCLMSVYPKLVVHSHTSLSSSHRWCQPLGFHCTKCKGHVHDLSGSWTDGATLMMKEMPGIAHDKIIHLGNGGGMMNFEVPVARFLVLGQLWDVILKRGDDLKIILCRVHEA